MDLGPYVRTLRDRGRALHAARARRAAELRSRLPSLVRILVEEFQVDRVLLFGSLLHGEIHDRSDLDLAVGGLRPADYFRAIGRLSEAAGVPVDLVPFEDMRPALRARIAREGELLHG